MKPANLLGLFLFRLPTHSILTINTETDSPEQLKGDFGCEKKYCLLLPKISKLQVHTSVLPLKIVLNHFTCYCIDSVEPCED